MAVPFEIPLGKWTRPVAGDLSASQYCGLVMSGANAVVAGNGARIIGILQNKPDAAGKAAEIQSYLVSKVLLGDTVTAGADVAMDATGRCVPAAGSDAIIGQCIVGGAVGQIGCIVMLGSVAADPRSHFLIVQDMTISGSVSRWIVSPVAGDIARVRTIVTTVIAGAGEAGAVALELAGTLVVDSGVVIAAEAAVGDTDDSGAIAAHATTAVTAGLAIELTCDSVPTSGAVTVVIEIVPS